MAQRKAHEVDRWLARPDAGIAVVLIYGPDRGLVSERARAFALSTGLALDDPFAVIRIDAVSDEDAGGRLLEEADTIGMFGGDRLIWLKSAGAQKPIADAVAALVKRPPEATRIVIEAGDLKKAAPLRVIVENAPTGMALPCFPDEERAVDGLIDEMLAKNGQAIDAEARRLLKRSLGADRLASRAEIEKLVLYAHGAKAITTADVQAAVGDASIASVDDVVDAILAGSRPAIDRALRKLTGSFQTQQVLAACMRQFQALQTMRGEIERGYASVQSAVAGARPPVFFTRRKLVEEALGAVDGMQIARILVRLQETTLASRRHGDLAPSLVRLAVLSAASDFERQRKRN